MCHSPTTFAPIKGSKAPWPLAYQRQGLLRPERVDFIEYHENWRVVALFEERTCSAVHPVNLGGINASRDRPRSFKDVLVQPTQCGSQPRETPITIQHQCQVNLIIGAAKVFELRGRAGVLPGICASTHARRSNYRIFRIPEPPNDRCFFPRGYRHS
jgi:hypothetical protein